MIAQPRLSSVTFFNRNSRTSKTMDRNSRTSKSIDRNSRTSAIEKKRKSTSNKPTYTSKNVAQIGSNGLPLYGMDKELAAKKAFRDAHRGLPEMTEQAREWVCTIVGPLGDGTLQQELKSGVVLCNLINAIQPGCCRKPSPSAMPFKQMENISNYLAACNALGMPKHSSFQTVTLFEDQDMMQVVTNLHALGAIAQKLGFEGEGQLGVKLADANVRVFTAEQRARGKAEQTFIGKGSSGQATACSIDRRKEIDRMKHVA